MHDWIKSSCVCLEIYSGILPFAFIPNPEYSHEEIFTTNSLPVQGKVAYLNQLSTETGFSVYIIYGQRVKAPSNSILCPYALSESMICF